MKAVRSPIRSSVKMLLAIAAAIAVTVWAGWALFREPRSQDEVSVGPRAYPFVPGPLAAESPLATFEKDARRSGEFATAEALAGVEARELDSEESPERDVRQEAWALVARLEELARSPETFHAAALPVIDLLTQVCSTEASAQESASAADTGAVVEELQRIVVADPQREPMVRGAAFLALAPLVSEAEFWGTFTEWLSGHSSVPLELVRTAALAAARSGSPSPCRFPLPLAKLNALPTLGAPRLPGFYPLALDRIASGRACDEIRRWLDIDDPRRKLFRLGSGGPPAGLDLESAGDYFVTVEILLCVWGHRSLEDTVVERALLQEAHFTLDTLSERSLVSLRAAHFSVLALARCNEAFFDFAVAMASDEDAPLSDLLGEIQGALGEELWPVTLALLERLRYSQRSIDRADLTSALERLKDDFGRQPAYDVEQRASTVVYLCGLANDPEVYAMARASAVRAVVRSGDWTGILEAASACFRPGAPDEMAAMVLPALMKEARSNPARRGDVLRLLRQFSDSARSTALKFGIDAYIAELSD